jgi:hypothetical protein
VNAKKIAATAVTTALVTIVPLAMLNPATAVAQRQAGPVGGVAIGHNAAAAASHCSGPPTGKQKSDPAPAKAGPITPNAWSSRLSGLPQGGAALYS